MIPVLLAFVGAVAPAAVLLSFVYMRDACGRKPLRLVLKVYFLSFFLVIPAALLELGLLAAVGMSSWPDEPAPLAVTALLAVGLVGLVEEGGKFLSLRWLVFRHSEFNTPYDGILYAVAVSLGFATAENLFYVLGASGTGAMVTVIILRALFSVPGHALWGIMMGVYVGRAKFESDDSTRTRLLLTGLLVAILAHGLYDFLLFSVDDGFDITVTLLLLLAFLATIVSTWVVALRMMGQARAESRLRQAYSSAQRLVSPAESYKFCGWCGYPAPVSHRFCNRCGWSWAEAVPATGTATAATSTPVASAA